MKNTSENLHIWNQVEVTDPSWLKSANVGGNKIKAINPQKQLKKATELWGPYGTTWGLESFELTLIELENTVKMWLLKGWFFYPGGKFPVSNTIKFCYTSNGGKYITDDEATKKLETNTISKSLSRLGFSSDVFEGMFEVEGYAKLASYSTDDVLPKAEIDSAIKAIKKQETVLDVSKLWNANPRWHVNFEISETYKDTLSTLQQFEQ